MDFWYNFQIQRKKLENIPNIQDIFNEYGQIQSDYEFFEEFRNHLPIIPEEFWQTAVSNIVEYRRKDDDNFQLEEGLIEYIVALISWYTDEDFSNIALNDLHNTSLLASAFYFRLLCIIQSETLKEHIYKNTFNCLRKFCKRDRKSLKCLDVLRAFRFFLKHEKLRSKYLEVTLFQLCKIIEVSASEIHKEFDIQNGKDLAHESLICMKYLAGLDWSRKSQTILNCALLHAIKCEHDKEAVRKNFSNLIIQLREKLKQDNFANFQQVFLYLITKSNSFDAGEAARLITVFDEDFCKDTIHKLTSMGISKEVQHKNNILRLFAKLLENLPTNFYEPQKLEVFIQSLFNVCVINCINNDEAIALVSRICLLNKDVINKQFKILLNNPTEYVYVENSLPVFCMKFNMQWGNRTKNRNIAAIIFRIMYNTYNITLDEQYAGIIAMIGNEADPSDLKMCIPLLLKLFIVANNDHSKYFSQKILELIYLMSIHPSAGSTEFVKILCHLILEPTEDIRPHKDVFFNILSSEIISDNKKFISRAIELNQLGSNSGRKLINKIMSGDYDGLRLTCAVFEKVSSPEGEKLIYHLMAKPSLLTQAECTADLLFIVHSGLKYFITYQRRVSLTENQQNSLRDFTKILWNHKMKFELPYNALGIGLDILELLSELTKEDLDFQALFSNINFEMKNALLRLPEEAYVIPMMYSTELISRKNYNLPDGTFELLETTLEKFMEAAKNQGNLKNAKMEARYYYSLVFMVRIAMNQSRFGVKAMKFLKAALDIADQEFKTSLIDLMYDLCTYVVHNFDEFLNYSFNELKSLNVSNRTQAAIHVEHFIRLDYLRLSLEQFCKFISLIGDPKIGKRIQNLLKHFVISNPAIIEKYFLSLIMHLNFYSVHAMCPMSPQYMQDMNCLVRANFNKWKVYSTLFRSLSLRSRFLILKDICVSFFDEFMGGIMKIEDGIWNVLNDSISLFKIMAYNSLENVNYETFYEEKLDEIKKYIIDRKDLPGNLTVMYPEMKDVIELITYSLLHLLFYTENEAILKNYKLKLFESILFWTHALRADIAAICVAKKEKKVSKILNYYLKLCNFYKNHKHCLNVSEYISEYNEANTFTLH